MPKKNAKDILEYIHLASLKLLPPLSAYELYKTIVEEAIKLVDGDEGRIAIRNGDSFDIAYASSAQVKAVRIRNDGFTATCIRENRSFVIHQHTFQKSHPETRELGILSAIFIPLTYHNKPNAALIIQSRTKKYFTKKQLATLKLFGSLASLAINKTQLFQQTAEALETRDLFIAMASHELKTPLTSINIYAQILKKNEKLKKHPQGKIIDQLASEVTHLMKLVQELLQIENIKTGILPYTFTQRDITQLLSQAVKNVQMNYPRHIFSFQTSLTTAPFVCDGDKLLQVFTNILTNAAKYSPEGSHITCYMEKFSDIYQVKIIDQGIGMKKEDITHIFDKFYKVSTNPKEGMGLGLYLAKEIINKHYGSISVTSHLGKGSTFVIKLPLYVQSK